MILDHTEDSLFYNHPAISREAVFVLEYRTGRARRIPGHGPRGHGAAPYKPLRGRTACLAARLRDTAPQGSGGSAAGTCAPGAAYTDHIKRRARYPPRPPAVAVCALVYPSGVSGISAPGSGVTVGVSSPLGVGVGSLLPPSPVLVPTTTCLGNILYTESYTMVLSSSSCPFL